ncbi:MAG TPA: DNA mismatch repair protein MutS, partial [Steroidobacteraceae bacterium]|nr:DNA mismatch repair protein MutS [Steroidobacteraceae bacterium]
ELPACANVHLDATEHADQLVFLHSVKEGPANQSYGLQVARLAGVPRIVIAEARRYLKELERREHATRPPMPQQELLLDPPRNEAESALRRMLEGVDPESLSPRAAIDVLYRLKELLDAGDA